MALNQRQSQGFLLKRSENDLIRVLNPLIEDESVANIQLVVAWDEKKLAPIG